MALNCTQWALLLLNERIGMVEWWKNGMIPLPQYSIIPGITIMYNKQGT
ncbi:MAG: hypothetical protein K8R86_06500 [Bacteroidales bacterium]|nr:hypothetical protein [Bacteroidales bacterium]